MGHGYKCIMTQLRVTSVRKMLAAIALLAVFVHTALVAQHALMPLGFGATRAIASQGTDAAVQQLAAYRWAEALGVPICHGTALADGRSGPPTPGKPVQQCLVCSSVLAAIAEPAAPLTVIEVSCSVGTKLAGTPDLASPAAAPSLGFEARGPPRHS